MAVKDGRLVRNPADAMNLPRVVRAERMYLTHDQVHQLAAACGEYRLPTLFLAYTGVRFGEMAALRVGRLDFLRRRALVAKSVTLVRGAQTWGTPKGHERREVPIPASCSPSWRATSPARAATNWYSPDPAALRCGHRDTSGPRLPRQPHPSVWPVSTRTPCDTPLPPWPSPPAPT